MPSDVRMMIKQFAIEAHKAAFPVQDYLDTVTFEALKESIALQLARAFTAGERRAQSSIKPTKD